MIDRLRRVLDDLGYPLGGEDLLDVLLLARVMDKARVAAADTSSPDPARTAETGRWAEDAGEDDIDGPDVGPADMEPPTRQADEGGEVQRRFLFPNGANAGPTVGAGARAVRLPSPRALPGAHSLARSLRPLRRHQDHPYRQVLDVEATLRLTAESGTLDVVLKPERELRYSAVLLVDDSLSMRVWRSLVPEIGGLLVRSGSFRTVRTKRFAPDELSPPRHGDGPAASVVFLLTDGVHPGWTSAATAEALAVWGARGPVAILNPLPRRLWRATRFRPEPQLFRAAQNFPTARQLVMLDPLTGERVGPPEGGGPALPVLSLSPASMAAWTQLLTGPAVPRLVEAADLLSLGAEQAGVASATAAAESPGRLVDVFRGSFSPQAYRLAVRLSALEPPLSPLLIQVVRGAALPEATSAHVAEVLLGGLLERVDDERTLAEVPESLRRDGLYTFAPGVRELLASALSRAQSQEIVEAVGRALKPYLGSLPDFTALVADASGPIGLPEHASPFAVMTDPAEQEQSDDGQTSGTPDQAEVGTVSEASGRVLLRASAGAVAVDARNGSLINLLVESYTRTHGHRPPAQEVRAWKRGLPSLADCLLDAALPEVEILIEFALPSSSRRVDVVLVGLDPHRATPSYMLVELKLWTSVGRDGSGTDTGLYFVDSSMSPVLDPVDQVRRYRDYLVNFNSVAAGNPERVSTAVYLPNATEFGVRDLRDDDGRADGRLFTGESRREFITYLRSRFVGGYAGVEAADELLLSMDRPPTKLIAVAAQEVRAQGQFILLDQQEVASRTVLDAIRRSRRSEHKEVVVITGGPGTGKSVVALHLLGELHRQGVPALHATGSQSFTRTLRRVVGTRRPEVQELFKYFNTFMQEPANSLGVLLCDEAHRVRETSANRYTRPSALTGRTQIEELIDVARVSVFLLDESQVVRPGEIGSVAEIVRVAESKGVPVRIVALDSQFGCGGSEAYLHWTSRLVGLERGGPVRWEPDGRMQLLVADRPQDMEASLEKRRDEGYAARMTAGYCWPWTMAPGPGGALPRDVVIDDWARPWNLRGDRSVSGAPPGALWASDPAGFGQVGSVYTAQGFEFDWSGVVIGPDLVWRGDHFVTDRTSSRDPLLRDATDEEADRMIRSAYRVLLTRSTMGTVVHSTDAETRAKLLELGGRALGAQVQADGEKQFSTVQPEERPTRSARVDDHGDPSAPLSGWDTYPALADLFPWGSPGLAAHRNWVVSPAKEVLESRWNQLVGEEDPDVKAALFSPTRDRSVERVHNALPGRAAHRVPVSEETSRRPDVVRIGMSTFDRQWLIADERVIDRPRPMLWAALRPGQIFLCRPSASVSARSGPALVATSLLPETRPFGGHGRVHPVLQSDGEDNVPPELLPVLSYLSDSPALQVADLAAYVMAVAGHPGFTERFRDALITPTVRIPLTRDPRLWDSAVRLGEEVLWASTYGDVCAHSASGRPPGSIAYEPGDKRQVRCLEPVGDDRPDEMHYDVFTRTVRVGQGVFGPVSDAVWSYDVGGVNILKRWFGYRRQRSTAKRSSPLDDISVTRWTAEWSAELVDLLTLLRRLTELAEAQDVLLRNILARPLVTEADLTEAGVFPVEAGARKPHWPQYE